MAGYISLEKNHIFENVFDPEDVKIFFLLQQLRLISFDSSSTGLMSSFEDIFMIYKKLSLNIITCSSKLRYS